VDGDASVGGTAAGRGVNGTRPPARDVARLLELWATAAEQRLPRAGATDAVWGDPLAAAGGAVSAGLRGVAARVGRISLRRAQ
jgi:hypothetical protein